MHCALSLADPSRIPRRTGRTHSRRVAGLAVLGAVAACRDAAVPSTAPLAPTTAAVGPAAGDVRVTEVLDLGGLPGTTFRSAAAYALNDSGVVVGGVTYLLSGSTRVVTRPFRWVDGVMADLSGLADPAAASNAASAVSLAGDAAGSDSIGPAAFRRTGTAALSFPGRFGSALGMNDAGDIVGWYFVDGIEQHAALWRGGAGTPVTLGGLTPVPIGASASAINNRGQAVGRASRADGTVRAVVFEGGRVTELPLLPGDVNSIATAVNDRGQVAGISGRVRREEGVFDAQRAVVWDLATGAITELGLASTAFGINDAGDVVGIRYALGPNYPIRATLWRGGVATELPGLTEGANSLAYDINNRGQAVGVSGGRAVRWTIAPASGTENAAPIVAGVRAEPAAGPYAIAARACGGRYTACVRYRITDADGTADAPFQTVVDWGDGTAWRPNSVPADTPLLAPHDYAAPGRYTVTVTVTDRRGAAGTASIPLVVIP